jgi:hypothetical protein
MRDDAEKIANLVMQTSTDNRGELLMQVAIILQTNFQSYTSGVFHRAAVDYSYQSKPEVIDKMIERLEWNDATKKLPDSGDRVLIWANPPKVFANPFWMTGYLYEGKWHDGDTGDKLLFTVTHWAVPKGPGEIRSKT